MAGVVVTPLAEADMAEIWGYIASDNRAAADRLIRQISLPRAARYRRGRRHRSAPGSIVSARWAARVARSVLQHEKELRPVSGGVTQLQVRVCTSKRAEIATGEVVEYDSTKYGVRSVKYRALHRC